MHAVQLSVHGQPLEDRHLDERPLGTGEVRISVEAAGICRSDLHYRSGFPRLSALPRTLGHEVAGIVTETGPGASIPVGRRVAAHYLVTCLSCEYCRAGVEQFCEQGRMLGKEIDGGFAESMVIPAANAFEVPVAVSTRAAAVMMCSTATVLHALKVAGVGPEDVVVVFGAGGLGQSAIQLSGHWAQRVVAVDPSPAKRELAAEYGAIAVDPGDDATAALKEVVGKGADIALDLVGSSEVVRTAIDVLAPMGRVVAVGLTADSVAIGPYSDLVTGERGIIGSSDHLASEIPELFELAARGVIDVDSLITRSVPLQADAVNDSLDRMAAWSEDIRTVVES